MRARRAYDGTREAVSKHAAFVQQDHMIVVANLVDEMGRPKDANSFVGDEASHHLEDPGPRLDIEPRRRRLMK